MHMDDIIELLVRCIYVNGGVLYLILGYKDSGCYLLYGL